jgi:hypothetical protein
MRAKAQFCSWIGLEAPAKGIDITYGPRLLNDVVHPFDEK